MPQHHLTASMTRDDHTELDKATADYWNAKTHAELRDAYKRMRAAGAPPSFGEEVTPGEKLIRAMEQPIETKFEMVDGVACVMMAIPKAGTYVPQHSHEYAHLSALTNGKVALWKDDVFVGTFTAPHQIVIEAHAKHLFQSLVDNTTILCIHRVDRSGEIEIAEEHQIV